MSNEDKNILNDFLNKQQAVDDFEKEALEGFSQLSNQEITALKHKTDDKAEKLFDKKNKPAAGQLPFLCCLESAIYHTALDFYTYRLCGGQKNVQRNQYHPAQAAAIRKSYWQPGAAGLF